MSSLESRASDLIAICEERLLAFDRLFASCISAKIGADNMASNLNSSATYALVAGQISAKVVEDNARALGYFGVGSDFGLKALELEAEGFPMLPKYMDSALYCALLAGRHGDAARVAKAVLEKARAQDDSSFYDGFARLISATILDNAKLFAEERAWVDARRSKNAAYWWSTVHGVYHDLQEAVLDRDVERFLALMDARESAYAARPKDRKMRDVDLKDGGNAEQNALVIDYMGTAIAKLAHYHGMRFEYDSKFVPAALIA